jgi:hypothetical protein
MTVVQFRLRHIALLPKGFCETALLKLTINEVTLNQLSFREITLSKTAVSKKSTADVRRRKIALTEKLLIKYFPRTNRLLKRFALSN